MKAAALLLLAVSSWAVQPDDKPDRALIDDSHRLIPADVKGRGRPAGWVRQSASLLYYDETGALANEIPLRTDEESSGAKVHVREMLGGASGNGRFGWTFERTTTWNADRTKASSSRRLLRFYGSSGKELWSTADADLPENGEPLAFSSDGEKVLVSLRDARGWTVAAKSYMGSTLVDAGPLPRLQLMTLTPNGAYAMIRWIVPDESATHTFIEIATKTRQDVPSSQLTLGLARITEDGKVYSGKRFVFDFAAMPKKDAPAGQPAQPPPPAPAAAPASGPDRP